MSAIEVGSLGLTKKAKQQLNKADALVNWYRQHKPSVDSIAFSQDVIDRVVREVNDPKVTPPRPDGSRWQLSDLRYRGMKLKATT